MVSSKEVRIYTVSYRRIARNYNRPRKHIYICDFRGIKTYPSPINRDFRNSLHQRYRNPEVMQKKVLEYFQSCFEPERVGVQPKTDLNGDVIYKQIKPFTLSGLKRALDLSTTTFRVYMAGMYDDPEEPDPDRLYSKILQRATQKIEEYAESRLYDKDGSNGAKYVLDCQFGWKTRKDVLEERQQKFTEWKTKEEMRLKQKILEDPDDDSSIEIRIVRKTKEED